MLNFLAIYLGKFLFFIYDNIAFNSYGIALILFTVIVRLFLLPLTIKQYHNTQKMQQLQPKMMEIQKRYKNDKEKLNQELMKFYQENNYNPAGGCLPLLIQMPILFSLYYVIRRPMTYMLGVGNDILGNLLIKIQDVVQIIDPEKIPNYNSLLSNAPELFNQAMKKDPYIEVSMINQLSKIPEIVPEGFKVIDLNFLKIFNLGIIPKFDFKLFFNQPGIYIPLAFLVILAAGTTFLSTKISMASAPKTSSTNANDPTANMTKSMLYFSPIMILFIGFSAPAGLALYWTINNVVQIFQQMYINKHVLKKKED